MGEALQAAYAAVEAVYISKNPKSAQIYDTATQSLPGGNTRTVLFYKPFPLAVASASGSELISEDGHVYVDLLGEYTAGLYGHSCPEITSAIQTTLLKGLSFGSHHADESRLARLITARFPSIDLVRFTNSGTEANLMAIGAARAFTLRSKVLVFEGGYHGGVLSFAHGASSPLNAPYDYLVARYNDSASVAALLQRHGADVAAILVEPMLGSGGAIPGTRAFLGFLRAQASSVGVLLVFDEVMTSRLYAGRGVQAELGICADLTTLGKWIGGGMSFGAFGGRADIMGQFDPRTGSLSHAGTFNNNVLTMAAGCAGLEQVFTVDAARVLHEKGETLRERLVGVAEGTTMRVTGCGSIMCFHFTRTAEEHILAPHDIRDEDLLFHRLLHMELLQAGFYIASRGFLALSLALEDAQLDGFVEAVRLFVEKYRHLLSY